MNIEIPAQYVSNRLTDTRGDAAKWLADLPELVETLCDQWGLSVVASAPLFGWSNIVFDASRHGQPVALRVGQPSEALRLEGAALSVWNGQGAVRLLEASDDDGAFLLERLRTRSLEDLELHEAAVTAAELITQLSVRADIDAPSIRESALGWVPRLRQHNQELGSPIPQRLLDPALDATERVAVNSDAFLVHADLHYGNILERSDQEWAAIDPRPFIGDAEYSIPELIWSRADELADSGAVLRLVRLIVRSANLDEEKALGWCMFRCVDYWLWGLRRGLTEDPERCERLLTALVG